MGQQVSCYKGVVGMFVYSDVVVVGNVLFCQYVYSGFGIVYQLFLEVVIGFFIFFFNDRYGYLIEYCIVLCELVER